MTLSYQTPVRGNTVLFEEAPIFVSIRDGRALDRDVCAWCFSIGTPCTFGCRHCSWAARYCSDECRKKHIDSSQCRLYQVMYRLKTAVLDRKGPLPTNKQHLQLAELVMDKHIWAALDCINWMSRLLDGDRSVLMLKKHPIVERLSLLQIRPELELVCTYVRILCRDAGYQDLPVDLDEMQRALLCIFLIGRPYDPQVLSIDCTVRPARWPDVQALAIHYQLGTVPHDCSPNCRTFPLGNGKLQVRTLRDLRPFEPIRISLVESSLTYGSTWPDFHVRNAIVIRRTGRECTCSVCSNERIQIEEAEAEAEEEDDDDEERRADDMMGSWWH